MKVYGVDFTSSPSVRKPITVAIGGVSNALLKLDTVVALPTLAGFQSVSPLGWSMGRRDRFYVWATAQIRREHRLAAFVA